MKAGIIEKTVRVENTGRQPVRIGFQGAGGGSWDDGGDDSADENFSSHIDQEALAKYRIGMFSLLLVVFVTFGSLIFVYLIVSSKPVSHWEAFVFPIQIWLGTF